MADDSNSVAASDHEPVRRERDVMTEDTTGKQVRSHNHYTIKSDSNSSFRTSIQVHQVFISSSGYHGTMGLLLSLLRMKTDPVHYWHFAMCSF